MNGFNQIQMELNKSLVNIFKRKERSDLKKVGQYNLDRNLKRTWLYMMKIEKELGYTSAQISKCCNGKIKTSYGFIWKFI